MAFPASVVLVSGRLGFQQKETGWARAVCHYLNQKVLISRLVLDSPTRKFGGLRLGDLWKGIADGRERQGEPDHVAEKQEFAMQAAMCKKHSEVQTSHQVASLRLPAPLSAFQASVQTS